MENEPNSNSKWFSACLVLLILATLGINLLSAYIRLDEAGVGCADWPDCYGRVQALIVAPGDSPAAALTPRETAKRAHRAIATGLVVLVLAVVYFARQRQLPRSVQHLPLALVAVVLLLSVIGPASYLKTLPAVASANIIGGLVMLGLAWSLWLGVQQVTQPREVHLRGLIWFGLSLLLVQLLSGAWTSANFAAAACTGLFDCRSGLDAASSASFWYFRELGLDAHGRIIQDAGQVLIQQAHHAAGVLLTLTLVLLSLRCFRAGGAVRVWGMLLLLGITLQVCLGFAMLQWAFPLPLVLLHGLLAAGLLMILLKLLFLTVELKTGEGAVRSPLERSS